MRKEEGFLDKLSDFFYEITDGGLSIDEWFVGILITLIAIPVIIGLVVGLVYSIVKFPVIIIPIAIFLLPFYMVMKLDKRRRLNGKDGLIY